MDSIDSTVFDGFVLIAPVVLPDEADFASIRKDNDSVLCRDFLEPDVLRCSRSDDFLYSRFGFFVSVGGQFDSLIAFE